MAPGGHPRPGLAHQRVEPVDERTVATRPPALAAADQRGAPARVDGQRLLAHDVLAGRQGRGGQGACRWLGVQMWTTSTSGLVTSDLGVGEGRSAPSRAAARPVRGDDAATPPAGRRRGGRRGRGPRR